MGVRIEASGPLALFSRPEMKVERVSYDMITPSAARGLLEAVYWHPGLSWKIDRIYVMNPIRFTNIRRNEVSEKLSADTVLTVLNGRDEPLYIASSEAIQQRASTLLRDVRYIIDAHFEMTGKASETDSEQKFYAVTMERLKRGKCFQQPYFGCREFPAKVTLFEGEPGKTAYEGEKDLGYMLFNMDYADLKDVKPRFFRAVLRDGMLDVAAARAGVVS